MDLRRWLIVGGIGLGVTVMVALLLLAASGGDGDPLVGGTSTTAAGGPTTTEDGATSTTGVGGETTTTTGGDGETTTTTTGDGATTTTTGGDGETTTTTGGDGETTATTTTTTTAGTPPPGDALDLDDPDLYREPAGTSYLALLEYEFFAGTIGSEIDELVIGDGGKIPGEAEFFVDDGDSCVQVLAPGGNPYDYLWGEYGILRGFAAIEEENAPGPEGLTINRYTITAANIDPDNPLGIEADEVFDAFIDVAVDGGYVIYFDLFAEGRADIAGSDVTGDIILTLDFSDFGTDALPEPLCPG